MQVVCMAPIEIPGISSIEASDFGAVAEDIIFFDFVANHAMIGTQVFRDANNPAAYIYFLAWHNPQFNQVLQTNYFIQLRALQLERIPDFLVHKPDERAFYEVKPDSLSGRAAGINKVGILRAVYPTYLLPYTAGWRYTPRDTLVAHLGSAFRATLRVRYAADGLLVYRLCLECADGIAAATILVLLAYIVREMNKQKGRPQFRPINLQPAFQRNQQLADLAETLGLTLAVAVAAVGWSHFWRAVAARFAVRGAAAAVMAVADGPLPVGDLLAAGLAIWTVVDIIRLSDELWRDAGILAQQDA